jgi:hypothetical protein
MSWFEDSGFFHFGDPCFFISSGFSHFREWIRKTYREACRKIIIVRLRSGTYQFLMCSIEWNLVTFSHLTSKTRKNSLYLWPGKQENMFGEFLSKLSSTRNREQSFWYIYIEREREMYIYIYREIVYIDI